MTSSYAAILQRGVRRWNAWREKNFHVIPDLTGVTLAGKDLSNVNFRRCVMKNADLRGTNFEGADLSEADLRQADLTNARLTNVDLMFTDFRGSAAKAAQFSRCDFREGDLRHCKYADAVLEDCNLESTNLARGRFQRANFQRCDFSVASLRAANFTDASVDTCYLSSTECQKAIFNRCDLTACHLSFTDFTGAMMVEANLRFSVLDHTVLDEADLTGASIYGIAVWNVSTVRTKQDSLNLDDGSEYLEEGEEPAPVIQVDSIAVAQFIYLLLENVRLREVLDAITSKVVLLLGRFSKRRKPILEQLRRSLRDHGYLPVVIDVDAPRSRDITETVSTIAHLARFVIADISEARSIPQELMRIVPALPSVPVQPLVALGAAVYGMFEHFERFPWVLPLIKYKSKSDLKMSFPSMLRDIERFLEARAG